MNVPLAHIHPRGKPARRRVTAASHGVSVVERICGRAVVAQFERFQGLGFPAMEEVGSGLAAGAGELVLESAPQMAEQVAAEELALAVDQVVQGVLQSDNAGAGVADGVPSGEFAHFLCLTIMFRFRILYLCVRILESSV